jgi:hypothetical protein
MDLTVELLFRVTGFLTMKVGKMVAISVGGSIILLQLASQEGRCLIIPTPIPNNLTPQNFQATFQ